MASSIAAYLNIAEEIDGENTEEAFREGVLTNLILGNKRIPVLCSGCCIFPLAGGNPFSLGYGELTCEITKVCNTELIKTLLGVSL